MRTSVLTLQELKSLDVSECVFEKTPAGWNTEIDLVSAVMKLARNDAKYVRFLDRQIQKMPESEDKAEQLSRLPGAEAIFSLPGVIVCAALGPHVLRQYFRSFVGFAFPNKTVNVKELAQRLVLLHDKFFPPKSSDPVAFRRAVADLETEIWEDV